MSLIFGDFLQNWLGPRKVAAWTFYGVMLVGFVAARAPTTLSPWGRESVEMVALQSEIARLEQLLEVTDEPILAASPHGFLQTAFYASPELRARLRYVALPSAALEFLSTDSGERALINIAPWAGLETSKPRDFLTGAQRFWIAENRGHRFDWITKKLRQEQAGLVMETETDRWRLMHCCEERLSTTF